MKFENNFTISLDKLLILGVLLAQIVYFIAIQPQQIMASVNTRYASKERVDSIKEDISELKVAVDKLRDTIQGIRNK